MKPTKPMCYIFWSCKNKIEAKNIISKLLDMHLIACASIFHEVESMYRWKGKIEESKEVKVILKTTFLHFDAIQDYIQRHCSYEIAEIVAVQAEKVHAPYYSWLCQ